MLKEAFTSLKEENKNNEREIQKQIELNEGTIKQNNLVMKDTIKQNNLVMSSLQEDNKKLAITSKIQFDIATHTYLENEEKYKDKISQLQTSINSLQDTIFFIETKQ